MDKLTPREPSEAERLAQALTDWKSREVRDLDRLDAAAELRRLAALSESNAIDALNYESRIERLQAENDALRAMHDAAPTVEADATPELLKAVRSVIAWYEAEDDHSKADFYKRLEMCRESETLCRAAIAKAEGHPAAPQPLQGGMSNNELLSQWKKKLPCVKPSECELSAFAVGAEVGFARARDLERQDWDRVHHVLAKHGEHPGRTDDHLADVIDRALTRLKAAAPQP